MTDAEHERFSEEILMLRHRMKLDDADFAGMLLGSAVAMSQDIGITKVQLITTVARTYDIANRKAHANDA